MQIFISHPNEASAVANEIAAKLRALGHHVYGDSDWPAGLSYDDRIEGAIRACDRFVFLITPESVRRGKYTLTELEWAKRRWPNPSGHVLPVMVAETALELLDPYISQTVSVLRPRGNIATDTVRVLVGSHIDDGVVEDFVSEQEVDVLVPEKQVNSLVEELISLLSRYRKAPEGTPERDAVRRDIDRLVLQIKAGFSPSEGTLVAGARLVKVIGVGNFGTVWEATHNTTGARVAVKIFRLERLAEGQMVARFRRSIRAMRLLSEPARVKKKTDPRGAVVKFYAEDPSGLAFSMALHEAGNLEDVGRFGWNLEHKLSFVVDVASAVVYSHENGVVHRDIKPANIVLDSHGKPVLTDFDISDIRWATSLSTTVEKGLGTPVFAAPEQLEDADLANEISDVYSLGRLLYYLLLERSPGYQIDHDPPLKNLNAFPAAVVEVVRRSTQFVPAKRFPSAQEFLRAVEESQTGAAARRAQVSRAKRWARANWPAIGIITLLVACAVSFGLWQQQVAAEQTRARVRAEEAESRANTERRRAEELASKLQQLQVAIDSNSERVRLAYAAIDELRKRLNGLDEETEEYAAIQARIAEREAEKAAALAESAKLKEEARTVARQVERSNDRAGVGGPPSIQEPTKVDDCSLPCELAGECQASPEGCLVRSDADCRQSDACASDGACSLVQGRCQPGSAADCAGSLRCQETGICAFQDGGCVANEVGCQKSQRCRQSGACFFRGGECTAASDETCGRTPGCGRTGACSFDGKKCSPGSKEDCEGSDLCRTDGLCSFDGTKCAHESDEDCRRSQDCRRSGACSFDGKKCSPGSKEDCEASKLCHDEGRCSFDGKTCVATRQDCMKSEDCRIFGTCSSQDGQCVAATAEDCRRSKICRDDGKCDLDGRSCVGRSRSSCAGAEICERSGRCTLLDGDCVVATNADCRGALACSQDGLCFARHGKCVAASEADCKRSEVCKLAGRCKPKDGRCI